MIYWGVFILCIGTMKRKRYSEVYSILIGMMITVLTAETWEIPKHARSHDFCLVWNIHNFNSNISEGEGSCRMRIVEY